jgi:hypothetical protein
MSVDAILLAILAIADLGLLVHLRMRRWQKAQRERVARSLQLAMQHENTWTEKPRPGLMRRAS